VMPWRIRIRSGMPAYRARGSRLLGPTTAKSAGHIAGQRDGVGFRR
jgi:hypothetical protein